MRNYFYFVLTVALAAVISFYLSSDNGLVSVVWRDTIIELSLNFFILLLLLFVILVFLLIVIASYLSNIAQYRQYRRLYKNINNMEKLISIELRADQEQGSSLDDERYLLKLANKSENSLPYYLAAANIANANARQDKALSYLQEAKSKYPKEVDIISLSEARIIATRNPKLALLQLHELIKNKYYSRATVNYFARLLKQVQDSAIYIAHKATLETYCTESLLHDLDVLFLVKKIYNQNNDTELTQLYEKSKSKLKNDLQVAVSYIESKIKLESYKGLADLLQRLLDRDLNTNLIYFYGKISLLEFQFLVKFSDDKQKQKLSFDISNYKTMLEKRLKKAHYWLQQVQNKYKIFEEERVIYKKHDIKHNDSHIGKKSMENKLSVAFLTVARIYDALNLWGQAISMYKESLNYKKTAEGYNDLITCIIHSKHQDTLPVYKEALASLTDNQARKSEYLQN